MNKKGPIGWLRPGQPISLDPNFGFRPVAPPRLEQGSGTTSLTMAVQLSGTKLKPDERGLVISTPIAVDPHSNRVMFQGRSWDETELRAATLFWDRIELTYGPFNMEHPDFSFLEKAGVLQRSDAAPVGGGGAGPVAAAAIAATFQALEHRDPGQWAISKGENSTHVSAIDTMPDRGILFRLANVLPVPGEGAPLPDVLEFKQKRRSELLELRAELERIYQRILAAPDQPLAERTETDALDRAALAALKVANESKLPFAFSDCQVTMNLGKAITLGALAAGATSLALPQLSAAVGGIAGVAGLFDVTGSVGWRPKPSAGPYAYLVRGTKELRTG